MSGELYWKAYKGTRDSSILNYGNVVLVSYVLN